MSILVIGNGLNSCVASSLFASVGNSVLWWASSDVYTSFLQEPGLADLYREQIDLGRLHCSNSIEVEAEVIKSTSFVLIDEIETEKLLSDYRNLFHELSHRQVIVILLTPMDIGEAKKLKSGFISANLDIEVCSVPVLAREGRAITDFSRPESIILGSDSADVAERVKQLFHPFSRDKNCVKVVTSSEAEFSCFAGHAMLATRLSFMNEMASLSEKFQVDIDVVRECIGADPRIGKDYLYPGCGFGGKTLALNLEKVSNKLKLRNDDLGLLDIVTRINERQKDVLFRKIWNFFKGELNCKVVAIWGASFKPKTDSISGAPAVSLICSLLAHGVKVRVYDPLANDNIWNEFGNSKDIVLCNSAEFAVKGADALAVCTEWKEFWSPDFEGLSKHLKEKVIFDGRNIYRPELVRGAGLTYFGIGRI